MFGLVTLVHLCPHIGIATVAFKSMPPFKLFLETIVRLRINHLFLAPPLLKHPATPEFDLTFLRTAMIAAAPLSGDIESAFRKLGGPSFLVTQGFGMTECGGSLRLMPLTDAKIFDPQSEAAVPPGNQAATQEAFDAQGFLRTGDIACMNADGYFYIVDRLKYMIKNKGYQVSPAELEAHLLNLETVEDVGVIGKPDERCGKVPVAFVFVVLSRVGRQNNLEAAKEDIMRSVRETKSEYKWLNDVFFVESIPRLPSGKIIAKQLKAMLDGANLVDVVIMPPTTLPARSMWDASGSKLFEMMGLFSTIWKRVGHKVYQCAI
ncbi:hypothetical protein FB45DRAFT_1041443 [Roridomyces roridus]|uniref:Uncharacterized protein n=1 Tax=Roridomyces roridus TaxID=1738132 RepID=A0AAD7B0J7_9AGAR|nr:hypothetical protein FB45DRAFT_1041443 [Roridomyces roridus]